MVYNEQVDYGQLFPLFATSYIKQETCQGGQHKNKFCNQTLKCILVGADSKSDGLLFYHPYSKQVFTADDGYPLDTSLPTGLHFNLTYGSDFTFNIKGTHGLLHPPHLFELSCPVYYHLNNQWREAKSVNRPINKDEYLSTIQDNLSGDIYQLPIYSILDINPTPTSTPSDPTPFPYNPWIKHCTKVTVYFPKQMKRPQQGYLICHLDHN